MRHAKPRNVSKTPAIAVGLALITVTGLCIGSLIADNDAPKKSRLYIEQTQTPGPSDEAPKEPTESREKASGLSVPASRESGSQSPTANAEGKSPASVAPANPDAKESTPTGKESDKPKETPEPVVTHTPKPEPTTPTPNPSETETPKPQPKPQKPVYEWFVADNSEQNRTWCDTRPSGSVKVQIGTMYKSYYDDKDPAKAWASWRVSNETETCP